MPYVLEYRSELSKWTAAAERYCAMLTDAGNVAAVAAFVFVNYGLLMILFRFEEATLEMRETGLLDGRDLIKAEATLPRTLGDRLWRGFITPAAPCAIRFMGVVVAHALVVSAICFLGAGLVVFAWNAWEAQEAARRYVVDLCVEIKQRVGCTEQFSTKSFLGDGAAVLARSSGEERSPPRYRAGVASMAWRTTRRFSTNAP